jgi:hypothetical protein
MLDRPYEWSLPRNDPGLDQDWDNGVPVWYCLELMEALAFALWGNTNLSWVEFDCVDANTWFCRMDDLD